MLEPGDLVEIERGGFSHWAMFAGDNNLIHLTVDGEGKVTESNGTIKKERFNAVVGECKWSKNNTKDREYKPRSLREILKDAEEWVGKTVRYSLITFNCEHFVNYLRYGNPESGQVKKVVQAVAQSGPIGWIGASVFASVASTSKVSGASKTSLKK
ncbi:phospholipase A and acyltransferase 4-like [Engraulis encrasicolus]|uniref:phospholipase A and acyltransferase 4-like n=1 Tax=Engraulis encrasicolus TaxID=184585 RepID=UPI002FCED045